jgi:hypothetical protein
MLRSDRSFRAAVTPRTTTLAKRSLSVALLAVGTAALLTACSPGDAEPTPSPTTSASPTASPTAEPTETAAPEETAPPFAIGCDALLTLEQLYEFNPNYSVDPGYTPSAATITQVVEHGGTACGYVNQTSGDVVAVAVATPTASQLETLGNSAASTSTAVPTYGTPPDVEGYFTQSGNEGEAQIFTGPYWIVLNSPALFEPGDAQQLVADVIGNLPAA